MRRGRATAAGTALLLGAAAAALYTGPLLILWGLYNKYYRRRGGRGRGMDDPA